MQYTRRIAYEFWWTKVLFDFILRCAKEDYYINPYKYMTFRPLKSSIDK